MMKKARLALLLPLAVAVALVGCSANKAPSAKATGKVTYKGQPVTGGSMQFFPKEGGSYSAVLKSDGTYQATQLPTGEMTVTVETESANKNREMPSYGGKKTMSSPPPPGVKLGGGDNVYVKIPHKYADPKTSDLKVTIKSGNNPHDFELKD